MDMTNAAVHSSQPEYTSVPLTYSDCEGSTLAEGVGDDAPTDKPVSARKNTAIDWLKTLWPLVIHFLITILITILVLVYISGRDFFIDERRPSATLADGTRIQTNRYVPLQSDITTIVSATIVVLNWAALGWATALYWRSSFLIMEKAGLRRRDLEWITSSGVIHPTAYFRRGFMSFIGFLLLLTLVPQYTSPLLTGSISWVPSSITAQISYENPMNFSVSAVSLEVERTNFLSTWVDWKKEMILMQASGFSNMAWNQKIEKGVFKRVLPGASQLSVNTTVSNVTIPIFWVSNIEWLTNYTDAFPGRSFVLGFERMRTQAEKEFTLLRSRENALIIYPEPQNVTDDLSPLVLTETQTVIIRAFYDAKSEPRCPANDTLASRFPSNTNYYWFKEAGSCLAFARVTYNMAAGKCQNCLLSSFSTLRNSSTVEPQHDTTKFMAARLMGNVTTSLHLLNSSMPSALGNIDDYVTEVLSRSYSGAWSALVEAISQGYQLDTNYSPALPSLQARVDLRRVCAWLALQLCITLAGIIFLAVQSRSQHPLIGSTGMIGFDLDTNDAPRTSSGRTADRRLMRVTPKGDGWKVIVESKSSKDELSE
ncbi:Transmembrane protein [Ceratobasidium theobromae]|uniref:Transmembrane protein n=1 Tax=Ceratobasidium theobromae TaxID=1582974 RepID=A0A5N5QLI1_9AGAM|nr:Transmembrane protein [Ceratobasidium theobromae]